MNLTSNKFRVNLSKIKMTQELNQQNPVMQQSAVIQAISSMSNIFKEFIKKEVNESIDSQISISSRNNLNVTTKREKLDQNKHQGKNVNLQYRDRYVQIQLPNLILQNQNSDDKEKNQIIIKRWFAQVCKASFSTAFNHFFQDKMTYQQTKLFCSQCILRNLICLQNQYQLSSSQMKIINDDLKKNISVYMGQRYPMTSEMEVNKRLQDAIKNIDNMQNPNNDLITKSKIIFKKRENEDYNDLIMKILNYAMETIDKKVTYKGASSTNYLAFQNEMIKIFQSIYMKQTQQIKEQDRKNLEQKQQSLQTKNKIEQKSQKYTKFNKQSKKQNEKIKQYTHYFIGRKMPQSVQIFTQTQIKSNHLIIRNSGMLRLLTKWCQQLEHKLFTQSYFINRNQSYLSFEGIQIMPDLKTKQILNKYAHQQKQIIQKQMQEIFENNYQMQSKLLKRSTSNLFTTYLSQLQESYGKFINNQVQNLHSYIIIYLNKLIHGLLSVAQKAFEQQRDRQYNTHQIWEDQPPNLLSFTIGDLMRCKFSSKEKEVLKILQKFQQLSQNAQKDQKQYEIRILRVKNRLKLGTNDVLINISFNKEILCQIQIAIHNKQSKFTQYSNNFNHYIYQIQRSIMGPITQLCSICYSLDSRIQTYKNINEKFKKNTKHMKESISSLKQISMPFICSQCNRVFSHNNYIKSHLGRIQSLKKSNYFLCALCSLNQESNQQILKLMFKNQKSEQLQKTINNWKRIKQSDEIPLFGICCKIQSKFINLFYFQKISSRGKTYIFAKNSKQRAFLLTNLNNKKQIQHFTKNYIIFQTSQEVLKSNFQRMDQISARKQFIIPQDLQEFVKKEKQVVSLNQDNLEQFPKGISSLLKVKTLNISGNNNRFPKIPSDLFKLPNLTHANFSSIKIDSLQIEQSSCSQLERLNLFQTGLAKLPQNINCLTNLKHLDLQLTNLQVLPDSIGDLKLLQSLFVSNTKITILPQSLGNLSSLTRFGAYQMDLRSLPQSFQKLQNLKVLELNSTQIKLFPEQITKLKKLEQLFLHQTKIRRLPQTFGNLSCLIKLSLNHTRLQQLPQSFKLLQNLSCLYLEQTKIKSLPESFGNLKNLQRLDLSKTFIKELPQQIKNLSNLKKIYLQSLSLQQFPKMLKQISGLQKITLTNNQLTQFPQELVFLPNLIGIYLEKNKITSISDQIKNLQFLQDLYLQQNLIKDLPPDIGTSIIQLNLGKNEISQFPKCIQRLASLAELSLKQTKISQIPDWFGLNKTKLTKLQLIGTLIKDLPDSLSNLTSLRMLDISNTSLQKVPQVIEKLLTLKWLKISGTKIAVIPKFLQKLINIQKESLILLQQGNPKEQNAIKSIECFNFVLEKGDQFTKLFVTQMLAKTEAS